MIVKRQPERTCIGCRSTAEKGALARFVRGPDGRIAFDPSGRAPGRGAYLHRSRACLRQALRRGAIARALRAPLGEAEAARLIEELEGSMGEEA
jgi:predicted RNA-binding protein YlxR (DUF448 family)